MWKRKKASQRSTADVLENLPHDADALRELQRVIQLEKVDQWMGQMHQEQRLTRRMSHVFRFGLLALFAAGVANTSYLIYTLNAGANDPLTDAHVGVVNVDSQIQSNGGVSATQIITGVRRALDNDATQAVVLNINSPGGSPTESQRVFHALQDFRDRHDVPIVSYIGDMGASGAYYIAAGTDTIYASPSSIVGSIGVISASFGFTEAMKDLGIERRVYTAGENKAMLDPFLPEDEQTTERFSALIDNVHDQFINQRGKPFAFSERINCPITIMMGLSINYRHNLGYKISPAVSPKG